jgi:hypothetical protein
MAVSQHDFLAFFPQFSSFSQGAVLPEYLRQANARFSAFGEDAEEARRLYVAHKLTLYSAACPPEGVTPTRAQLALSGRGAMQEVASKKVGEVSVSYTSSAASAASVSTGLADLKETVYGLQLLSLLRLYGCTNYFK